MSTTATETATATTATTTQKKVKGTGFKWGQELDKWRVAYEELQEINKKLKKENDELAELKRKMRYLKFNHWTVFCEVHKYGNDHSDSEDSEDSDED